MSEIYFAEYSASQGAYHIESVGRALEINMRAVMTDLRNDYLPFSMGTHEECRAACDAMRRAREDTEDPRSSGPQAVSPIKANGCDPAKDQN